LLFTKPLTELTAADIREFSRRFSEGLRVEYKSALSDSVRSKIPAIVSSFANSFGGVLVLGVNTIQGAAVEPIEGYETPEREELSLTIQNSCIANINPPVFPRTRQISSDQPGKSFLVVEVDASEEAPHAIENSRKVYVRTGDSSRPYDIAEIGVVERLIERRTSTELRKADALRHAEKFSRFYFNLETNPLLEIVITPAYPDSPIADREAVYRHLTTVDGYRGAAFRMPDGGCLVKGNDSGGHDIWKWTIYGHLFGLKRLGYTVGSNVPGANTELSRSGEVFPFVWIANDIHKFFQSSAQFFQGIGYQGPIELYTTLLNVRGRTFVGGDNFLVRKMFCLADQVPAVLKIDSAALSTLESLLDVFFQLLWPFFSESIQATRDETQLLLSSLFGSAQR
jgi:hypothetical protein